MGIKRTVSIRQIDLWGSEPLESKKIKQKMQITEMSIFPLYFLGIPLYNVKAVVPCLNGSKFAIIYHILFLWWPLHKKNTTRKKFEKKTSWEPHPTTPPIEFCTDNPDDSLWHYVKKNHLELNLSWRVLINCNKYIKIFVII